jgi:hypothetical protein
MTQAVVPLSADHDVTGAAFELSARDDQADAADIHFGLQFRKPACASPAEAKTERVDGEIVDDRRQLHSQLRRGRSGSRWLIRFVEGLRASGAGPTRDDPAARGAKTDRGL